MTDRGTSYLRSFPKLKELKLAHTEVSDAALVHLKELKRLQWLSLVHTLVSEAALRDIRNALPNTRVSYRVISFRLF